MFTFQIEGVIVHGQPLLLVQEHIDKSYILRNAFSSICRVACLTKPAWCRTIHNLSTAPRSESQDLRLKCLDSRTTIRKKVHLQLLLLYNSLLCISDQRVLWLLPNMHHTVVHYIKCISAGRRSESPAGASRGQNTIYPPCYAHISSPGRFNQF